MSISGSLVLFAIFWFLGFFCVLPIGIRTQSEADELVPGTPESAPTNPDLGWKIVAATGIACLLLAVTACIIEFELITIKDIQQTFERLGRNRS